MPHSSLKYPPSHVFVSQDNRYLMPRVLEVTEEDLERQKWDNLTVSRHR